MVMADLQILDLPTICGRGPPIGVRHPDCEFLLRNVLAFCVVYGWADWKKVFPYYCAGGATATLLCDRRVYFFKTSKLVKLCARMRVFLTTIYYRGLSNMS